MIKRIIPLLIFLMQAWSFSALASKDTIDVAADTLTATETLTDPAQATGAESGQVVNTDATDNQYFEDEKEAVKKDESHTLGLLGVILGGVAFGTAAFIFLALRKKLEATEIKALNEKTDNDKIVAGLKKELETLNNKYEETARHLSDLTEDLSALKLQVSRAAQKRKEPAPNPHYSEEKEETQRNKRPTEQRTENKPANKNQISYVSSLSMDDGGELTIPLWSLEPDNHKALFRIQINPDSGVGFYELNPEVENISSQLDKLKSFAHGVVPGKTYGYKTLTVGQLRREGQELKILSKLMVG